jgi:hypothetical protein
MLAQQISIDIPLNDKIYAVVASTDIVMLSEAKHLAEYRIVMR